MTRHWPVPAGLHMSSDRLPVEGELASFAGATYTCIDWLRQLVRPADRRRPVPPR